VDRVALIVNPRAGKGRVGRELPRLLDTIADAGAHAEVLTTRHAGHATALARSAAEDGAATVVAVGGDGTVNEVVNGLIEGDRSVGESALGVVAAGSGADFARTFGFPPHTGTDLRGIVGAATPLDIGRIECQGPDGPVVRYFVNVAEAGMAAATVRIAERLPRGLGKSRYFVAFWPTLARYRPCQVTVTADDATFSGRSHNALIANARYFGGGMHISPRSLPDDGIADLQVNVGPKRQAFLLIPKFYKGTHLPDDRIVEMHGRSGSIDAERPIPVEADGELVGATPLTYRILPGVLRLRTGTPG
jgi:YegS/Rv2252/BmrU family lipid kinase